MAFIVEMWGEPSEKPKNRFFQCGAGFWDEMLSLGKQYGWVSKGTIPSNKDAYLTTSSEFNSNYEPEEYSYAKVVLKEDALAWADALEKAVSDIGFKEKASKGPVILREDMTREDYEQANRAKSKGNIIKFSDFLKLGAFGFAWDD